MADSICIMYLDLQKTLETVPQWQLLNGFTMRQKGGVLHGRMAHLKAAEGPCDTEWQKKAKEV